MLFLQLILLAVLSNSAQIFALNDWSKPCFQGECSYDLPESNEGSGSLKIVRASLCVYRTSLVSNSMLVGLPRCYNRYNSRCWVDDPWMWEGRACTRHPACLQQWRQNRCGLFSPLSKHRSRWEAGEATWERKSAVFLNKKRLNNSDILVWQKRLCAHYKGVDTRGSNHSCKLGQTLNSTRRLNTRGSSTWAWY